MTDQNNAPKQFTKKPVTIEAIQWTGGNVKEVMDFMNWRNASHDDKCGLNIHTLEGTHHASINDWIIKGVKGEFYPCKPDIFEATYTRADRAAPTDNTALVERHANNAPERIWLRVTDKTVMYAKPSDADDFDVEYIRADRAAPTDNTALVEARMPDQNNAPERPSLEALIDLIGEFGREVYYMLDDCETSGAVGEEIHTITAESLTKVSAILDRIDALPFEEPGVILGTGAMLQTALKQTLDLARADRVASTDNTALVEAAYHAGIDAAANRYRVCASPDVWDYFYTAYNAMLDLKTFPMPAALASREAQQPAGEAMPVGCGHPCGYDCNGACFDPPASQQEAVTVAEAAAVLLGDPAAIKVLVNFQLRHSASASDKARSMRHVQVVAALRALKGESDD